MNQQRNFGWKDSAKMEGWKDSTKSKELLKLQFKEECWENWVSKGINWNFQILTRTFPCLVIHVFLGLSR